MSFTTVERAEAPLYRSKLFLPGSQVKFFEKAAKGPADVVCLDLEDAVAPNDKEQARKNIVEALNTVDFGDRIRSRALCDSFRNTASACRPTSRIRRMQSRI